MHSQKCCRNMKPSVYIYFTVTLNNSRSNSYKTIYIASLVHLHYKFSDIKLNQVDIHVEN